MYVMQQGHFDDLIIDTDTDGITLYKKCMILTQDTVTYEQIQSPMSSLQWVQCDVNFAQTNIVFIKARDM